MGANKEASWSGTRWALEQALHKYFEITDIELKEPALPRRVVNKMARALGMGDFDLGRLAQQQATVDKCPPTDADVWFQFSEAPMVREGERHYIYQDLAVEWLARCSVENPETYRWTGFDGISTRAIAKRLALQREFYSQATGIFTMGKWMANYLVNEVGIPSSKVFHVGEA